MKVFWTNLKTVLGLLIRYIICFIKPWNLRKSTDIVWEKQIELPVQDFA